METNKYETRKARGLDMLKSGVEPIKTDLMSIAFCRNLRKTRNIRLSLRMVGIPANALTTKNAIYVSTFFY